MQPQPFPELMRTIVSLSDHDQGPELPTRRRLENLRHSPHLLLPSTQVRKQAVVFGRLTPGTRRRNGSLPLDNVDPMDETGQSFRAGRACVPGRQVDRRLSLEYARNGGVI